MDDPKKRESAWQVDDILKELGMLDGGVSDMPSTPAPEKPESDEVTVEFPEEQEAVVTSPEDGDETKNLADSIGRFAEGFFQRSPFHPAGKKD